MNTSLFSHSKKPVFTPFKDYYTKWFDTLKTTLLPRLNHILSSPASVAHLSTHLNLVLHHFLSYYDALDLAATASPSNLPHLLYPSWRSPLEKPFLFLGDLHPYLFTNLLRSFLDREENVLEDDGVNVVPWQSMLAWKDAPKSLMIKIEQIECGLRLMVPALVERVKKAQAGFVGTIAEDWGGCVGKKERLEVGEAMKGEMEELVSVLVDANRLRRSVVSEIVAALSVYQGAFFLQALAQFLVGFRDPELLREFKNCKN